MWSTLFAMTGFALVGAITPGPVNVLALQHGHTARRVAALGYVLGASTSYALVVWLMGQGAGQVLQALPALIPATQWLCAAYLLWLAWRIVRSAPSSQNNSTPRLPDARCGIQPLQAFTQGASVQLLNPKAWLVALSGVGLYVLPHNTPAALYGFCAISLAACLLGVGFWAVAGSALRRWLHSAARQRALNRVLAAILVASVVAMLA